MMVPAFLARATLVAILLLTPRISCSSAAAAELPSLLDATLDQLRQGLDSGKFTSVDLTRAYLARIKEVSQDLRAVNDINPDALAIAAELDRTRKLQTSKPGPLHGIPVLLKDNIATADGMNNTCGSYALVGAVTRDESTVADKLRQAGAILLGKTNLSQWAYFRSLNSSHGWSSYGGQTKGAYFPDQDPSGSSSGSAVAASIGLAWASVGTETDNSLIWPCNVNNLVGIKPTVGLTSRHMVMLLSKHQDSVGPMARTVKDAAYLLAAITGRDSKDNYTQAIPLKEDGKLPDYVAACKQDGLSGKRIGIPSFIERVQLGDYGAPVMEAFRLAVGTMTRAGAIIVSKVELPGIDALGGLEGEYNDVLSAEFVHNLEEYLSHLEKNPNGITDLQGLKNFTESHAKEEYPTRDTAVWEKALKLGFNTTSSHFHHIRNKLLHNAGHLGVLGALKNHSLDAIALPTALMPLAPAIVGSPAITVPMGSQPDDTVISRNSFNNLNAAAPHQPFGIGFMGHKFGEETLIGITYAFEQRTNAQRTIKPLVKPKTELKDVVGTGGGRV